MTVLCPPRRALRSSTLLICILVSLVSIAFSAAAEPGVSVASAPDPQWWPEGAQPSYATLGVMESETPRAVLLKSASFRTDVRSELRLPAALRAASLEQGGWALVQFRPESTDVERRALLERYGALVLDAIPQHTRLARLPGAVVGSLAAEPSVAWVGPLHPAFKLSPLLGSVAVEYEEFGIDDAWRIRLRLAPHTAPARFEAALAGLGMAPLEQWADGALVELDDASQLVALARLDEVLFIEDAPVVRLVNDRSRGICQSGEPGVESIHAKGLRGMDQIVAVMDSGIDEKHCCFNGLGKIVNNAEWGGQLGALCSSDHGTHVAGTVACANAGDHDGLAPDAGIILQDIQGSGWMACMLGSVSPPSSLTDAWQDAYNRGARIHTNSWGGGSNAYGSSAREIDSFMWEHQDFLILYAAGNAGPRAGSVGSYSNAKNSLTIGGVNNASPNDMYNGSSRGPGGDGRTLPDLLAPAQGVSSALNKNTPTCGFTSKTGTSMATPAAAGSAALVREYYVRGFYPNGSASGVSGFSPAAALIKATMLASTRDITGYGTGDHRPNTEQGFGRLTLDDALWFEGEATNARLHVLDDRNTGTGFSAAGQVHEFELGLRSTATLKIVLAWTDAPGSPSAGKALVNDLDLEVEMADGTVYRGGRGFSGGWTASAASDTDTLNNKEAVLLRSPLPGPVTIRVRATTIGDVAAHAQDYALVAVTDAPLTCGEAPIAGPGNTAMHTEVGNDLSVSFAATPGARHVVYRGTSPDFMRHNPSPYLTSITDEDPGQPGVQWRDAGVLGDGQSYYYLYFAADGCDRLVP